MIRFLGRFFVVCAVFLASACGSDSQTAGGGDDFPNSLGTVLAQGMLAWGDGRSLRPYQEGVDTLALQSSSGVLSKTAALAKIGGYTVDGDTLMLWSIDTLDLRIVIDTVRVAWDSLAKDTVKDNERVYYFAERKVRRATGAFEYQRMVPLDTYLRAPDLDSARIRSRTERLGWRSGLLDGQEDVSESLDMDFVHFPEDTLRNYPLSYHEMIWKGDLRLETLLLDASGGSVLRPDAPWLLRTVRLDGLDSMRLQEVGVVPGERPWHGSARFGSFRMVDYVPLERDWLRTELSFIGSRDYAEGEAITEGEFRLIVLRSDGEWVLQGVFDALFFRGSLTGPAGQFQEVEFKR